MTRTRILSLATIVGILGACQALCVAGDWFDNFSHEVHVGFWRNNCWPKPFVYPDRKAAFAPMDIMAHNGWRRNNLLGAHHFDYDVKKASLALNESGKLRVQWILTQAPLHRRTIFVERSVDSVETGHRIETAQQYATAIAPEGPIQIVDTHIISEGRPAVDVDMVNQRFLEAAPVPMLPEASASMTGE